MPDPKILPGSLADAAAVNPNGIKILLANVLVYYSLKPKQFLVTEKKVLLRDG